MHHPAGLMDPSTTLQPPGAPFLSGGMNCTHWSQRWPSFGWSWYFIACLVAFDWASAVRASNGTAAAAATYFSMMRRDGFMAMLLCYGAHCRNGHARARPVPR